ncbi:hybrid sensor histidine kinase/response regulator [Roseimaritima ulvae]|uniref:histidine kinase n=1 Tax=Roseimaritima ulvae TaxID=980254 RepID=A0A5B9QWW2_9BACT|nr:ATP-binding protein [Roseimaritima ulvae]QEG41875.1 Autoinducer 2 sensor kinase/phosphatase LuxQ [Roseimaritima ulvae]
MTGEPLQSQVEELRRRLAEAENTIEAIRSGEVDAFVVHEGDTPRIYTLQGADRPYRLLVEQMQQGAVTLTEGGDIAYCNRRFAEMLKRPHRGLIGRSLSDFVVLDCQESYSNLLRQGRASSAQAEAYLVDSEGTRVPVFLTFSALDPESGVAIGVLITDLTSQRSHERLRETTEQLRINEERYRTLFQSIDEGFCVLETLFDDQGQCVDYRFIEVNPAFEKQAGLVNAVGRTMREMAPQMESNWFEIYGQVAKTGQPRRFVNQAQELSRWFNVYAFRLGGAESRRVAVLFTDITHQLEADTELKLARSQLQSTLNAAEIGTWEFDLITNSVQADANLANMLALSEADANGGPVSAYMDAIHPDDRPLVLKRIRQVIERGHRFEVHCRIAVQEQPVRHLVARGRVERDVKGCALRLPGVVMDVTAQRQAEESLRESEQHLRKIAARLEEADRRKDQFLATLAHELRNPLAPIKSAAQMMQDVDEDPAQLRELSALIDRQADQMVRLIDDLLDVSRIRRGKLKLRTQPIELRKVVAVALEAAAPFIADSKQTLHVYNPDPPLYVMGDAARLTQVLVNLLNNAAKYTPPAGNIWLSVQADETQAIIEVRDDGIGLSQESSQKIFEMFEQVDVSKERGQSGLGIGLSLAKTLIDLHGGQISVESPGLNQGCRFTVQLPLLQQYHPPQETEGQTAALNAPESTRYRILVVDDTRGNRFVLARMLRKMGHEVREAVDGLDGYQQALQWRPDVIFSDISMPNMNGHELAKKIRQTQSLQHVRMVALTGFGQAADRQQAFDSGFDEHIVKPVDIRVVQRLLLADLPSVRQPPG